MTQDHSSSPREGCSVPPANRLVVAALDDDGDVVVAVLADFDVLAVADLDDGRGVVLAVLVRQGAVVRAHLSRAGDVAATGLDRGRRERETILAGDGEV